MRRRKAGLALAGVLIAVGIALPVTADPGHAPTLVRTIGGSGEAATYPSGAEIDPADGAYVVADTGNDRVERYSASGALLWSVGGFGMSANPLRFSDPRDIGIDSSGDVYVADTGNVRIVKLDGATGAFVSSFKGPANDKIGSPIGVTVSAFDDQVYVADAGKKKVRAFDQTGNQLFAFGETAGCLFSAIRDVDAGPSGMIFIANYLKNNILRMSPAGACLGSWGTKGTGNGQFKNPYGVRVITDPEAGTSVFVADSNNNRVQQFTPTGGFLQAFGGTGTADDRFGGMRRVAVGPPMVCPQGQCMRVAGSDLWGWKLGVWTGNGVDGYVFTTTVPAPVVPPAGEPSRAFVDPPTEVFNEVRGVAFDASGELRVADTVNQRMAWLESDGSFSAGDWRTCGKRGWQAGAFNWPRDVAVDHQSGQLWVADTKQSRLQVIDADCTDSVFVGSSGSGAANFNWPFSIDIRQSDRIAFVADTKNHRIKAYDVATRTVIATFGSLGSGAGTFNQPVWVRVDQSGNRLFVADKNNHRIVELSFNGISFSWIKTIGGTGVFKKPEAVAADASFIYVVDTGNNRVQVLYRSDGATHSTITGFWTPQAVTVGPDDCIYVSDTHNDVVKVYDSGGACS